MKFRTRTQKKRTNKQVDRESKWPAYLQGFQGLRQGSVRRWLRTWFTNCHNHHQQIQLNPKLRTCFSKKTRAETIEFGLKASLLKYISSSKQQLYSWYIWVGGIWINAMIIFLDKFCICFIVLTKKGIVLCHENITIITNLENNQSITSNHRSIWTNLKSNRAGIRTQTKTTWKKVFFCKRGWIIIMKLWCNWIARSVQIFCCSGLVTYAESSLWNHAQRVFNWLDFNILAMMMELQRIAAGQWWSRLREFKWKIISYFYGYHHWICSSLSKKSDIAELRVVKIVVQIRSVGNDLKIWLKLYTEESHSMKRLVNPWTTPFSAGKCFPTLGWPDPSVRRTDHQPPHVYWSGPMGPSASTMSPRTWGTNKKKSRWLSPRIPETWIGASFRMTSASASSSFTSSGCWSARFTDSEGSWALDKMSISSVGMTLFIWILVKPPVPG